MATDPVYRHAEQLLNQKKYQDVIDYCDRVIARDEKVKFAWLFRGGAYRYLGNEKKAIEDYTRALKLDPALTSAYEGRGTAYRMLAQYGLALDDYNKLLELNPRSVWALEARGAVYRRLGYFQKARNDVNAAIALDARRELALFVRGLIHLQHAEYEDADADITRSLEVNPTALAFEQRAAVRRHLNRDRDALQDCLSALRKDSALVFAKELQSDLRDNLNSGCAKVFIYNSLAPSPQYYIPPRYQFFTPTPDNPAPSAPSEDVVRHLFKAK